MGECRANRMRLGRMSLAGVVVASAAVVAALSGVASSAAGESAPITLSGPSPLANCPGLPGTITNFTAEPSMAVNPVNHDNIVAAWQQDRSFAARGNVVSYSRDGGRTRHEGTVPRADTRTPGQLGVGGAGLSFYRARTAYLARLVGRPPQRG